MQPIPCKWFNERLGGRVVLDAGDVFPYAVGALVVTPADLKLLIGEDCAVRVLEKLRACPERAVSVLLTGRVLEN